jgi:hypothetical protein
MACAIDAIKFQKLVEDGRIYDFLVGFMDCHNGVRFRCKSVWRTKIPLRVAVFDWSASLRNDPYHG